MFDAGNLITMGVVLVILIAYRILDRDNRSLEKVKKYTDRLKEELDAFAAERAQALKGYAVEVDTHKKSAKEVLRQVQEAEKDLASRAEGINLVAQRIGEYDKALSELKNMSLRVDENLRIIHEESGFVDGLAKTLRNTKGELDKLHQEIPALREAAYQESLASSQNLAETFRQNLAASEKTAEEKYANIRKELDQAFAAARDEAQKLEASSFLQLKQLIDARGQELQSRLQANSDAISANSQASSNSLQTSIDSQFSEIRDFAASRLQQLKSELSGHAADISSQADSNDQKLMSLIEKRFGEIEQYARVQSDKLEEAVETRFGSLKEQAKEKVAETQSLLKTFKQEWHKEADQILGQVKQDAEALASQLEPLIRANEAAISQQGNHVAERLKLLEEKSQEAIHGLQAKFKENLKAQQEEIHTQQVVLKTNLKEMIKLAQDDAKQLKVEVEGLIGEAAKQFEANQKIQEAQNLKIAAALEQSDKNVNQTINTLNEKFVSRSSDLEQRVLAGFEKRSQALRSLVEQGLDRLEASRLDVIQLEKALRQTMGGVEKRVEEDFALFAKDVTGRHEAFEAKLASEAAKLQNAMKALDEDLNTLKANAYDNVSEQLKIFEDEFFNDLKKRREDTEEKLQIWRGNLDEHLASALHDADTQRAEAERAWLEEARRKAVEIQQRVTEALDKLGNQVDAHRQAISERMSEADDALVKLRASIKTDIDETRSAANAWVSAEIARWKQETSEQLQKTEQKTISESLRLQELVRTTALALEASRDDLSKQLENTGKDLAAKLEEAEKAKDKALESLSASFNSSVQILDKEWKTQRSQLVEASKAERDLIAREVRNLSEELDRLRQDLGQKTNQALDEFDRLWESRQTEAQKKLQDSESAMANSVQTFLKEEKNLQTNFMAVRDRLQKTLDDERKEREKVFAELDKQLKAFQTQTRLFERADELKLQLGDALEGLKADLTRTEARRAEMAELETQYGRIKRAEDDLNQKITRFFAEKRRIDTMEEDFKRLLVLSQAVDQKLASVTASSDQLTQIQADMRRLMESSGEALEKYDRVEKKSSILDATADAIDKNFQAISELERNVRTMDADIKDIPERIIQLKRSMEEVAAVEPQINASLDRIENMSELMKDAEKRASELQKAREWLARAETRFEELNKKTNEHLKLLNDILKDEPATRKDKSGAPPLSVQESVRKLAHQGWKTEEIARAVKLSRGEVELILELSGDK